MPDSFFTIGMAGHIDHGKTTLTKALTNIDTDRLKEEKLRNISIEPGFAPIDLGAGYNVSIIDVPGHERFIRQMIAGVAGIDLVVLVVAGDEGVMPQTKEHVEILSYLGIEHAIIAVTKIDKVETDMLDLVKDDIQTELSGTIFAHAPLYFVDSVSGSGTEELKRGILESLPPSSKRIASSPFRMPIDQSFTLQGKGAIVRGTVFDGTVREGDSLTLLPSNKTVRVKQLQVHKQSVPKAVAGQRAAINLGGITASEVDRGYVLTSNPTLSATKTVDLVLSVLNPPEHMLKQRSRVKFHTGTTEVMGTIVFFDRNELSEGTTDEILCQIRLDEPVALLRDDRFIIRRPTPVETIGGGWILDPHGEKYKYGDKTIQTLQQKKEGTIEDRVITVLQKEIVATVRDITKDVGESQQQVEASLSLLEEQGTVIELSEHTYVLHSTLLAAGEALINGLTEFHERYPMRLGRKKAEIIQEMKGLYPSQLIESVIENLSKEQKVNKQGPLLYVYGHKPSFPEKWEKRFTHVIDRLKRSGIKHEGLRSMFDSQSIPSEYYEELEKYLLETDQVFVLEDGTFVDREVFIDSLVTLNHEVPELFTVQDAKAVLDLSRKYCVMLLEKFDDLGITVRIDNERKWVPHKLEAYLNK